MESRSPVGGRLGGAPTTFYVRTCLLVGWPIQHPAVAASRWWNLPPARGTAEGPHPSRPRTHALISSLPSPPKVLSNQIRADLPPVQSCSNPPTRSLTLNTLLPLACPFSTVHIRCQQDSVVCSQTPTPSSDSVDSYHFLNFGLFPFFYYYLSIWRCNFGFFLLLF